MTPPPDMPSWGEEPQPMDVPMPVASTPQHEQVALHDPSGDYEYLGVWTPPREFRQTGEEFRQEPRAWVRYGFPTRIRVDLDGTVVTVTTVAGTNLLQSQIHGELNTSLAEYGELSAEGKWAGQFQGHSDQNTQAGVPVEVRSAEAPGGVQWRTIQLHEWEQLLPQAFQGVLASTRLYEPEAEIMMPTPADRLPVAMRFPIPSWVNDENPLPVSPRVEPRTAEYVRVN